MIITNKQFPNYRKYEMMYEGRPLSMEVGKMAELRNAAVLVKYGDTTVLVTCTACLACYHYCPTHAIAYGSKTQGKHFYTCPF